MALTPQQEKFCREYIKDGNATAAYHRANPHVKPDSANAAGARLLANVSVANKVAELRAIAVTTDNELTPEWVIGRLKAEAALYGAGSSPSARVAALKLLGVYLGILEERKVVRYDRPAFTLAHLTVEQIEYIDRLIIGGSTPDVATIVGPAADAPDVG